MSKIIPGNTQIPTSHTKEYYTSKDNQRMLKVNVYEGERDMVEHNNLLDEFTLIDLPPRPKGQIVFDVHFEVSEDGILKVAAWVKQEGG